MKFFRQNALDKTLWFLFIASLALMFKSSTDPMPDFVKHIPLLEACLTNFTTGNQITFDITVGVIVSLFMYVLVVRLPAREKKKRLKAHLLRCYDDMKSECIMQLLFACNNSVAMELRDRLKDQGEFRTYFKEQVTPDQERWDVVLNNLTDAHVQDIVHALDIFRGELEYVLTVSDVNDDDVFGFLRNLTEVLKRSRNWGNGYDEIKPLSQFMWQLCTGWSPVLGYTGSDHIGMHIQAM